MACRIRGVDEHDVEVAGQATVLESVVENEQVAGVLVECPPGRSDSIGILQVGNVWAESRQQPVFIIAYLAVRPGRGGFVSVTSAEQSDRDPVGGCVIGCPGDQGRLSRATGGQVADADHRCPRFVDTEQAAPESECTQGHTEAIGPHQQPQQPSQHPGARATSLTGDQGMIGQFVHAAGNTRIAQDRKA